MIPVAVIQ